MTSTRYHALPRFGLAILLLFACSASLLAASANRSESRTANSTSASDSSGDSSSDSKRVSLPPVSDDLIRTLSQQATINWQQVPLREAMTRLGTTFDLPWFMDRRIDPNQLVQLTANQLSIAAMLDDFAEQNGLSVTLLERVIYFGPPEGAAELLESWQRQGASESIRTPSRTALNQSSKPLANRAAKPSSRPSSRLRKALAKRGTTDWPHLTEPRRLIEQLLSESRIKGEGTDLIPHDLWTSGSLPELALRDRLCLLLVGFELDWQFDAKGRSIEIVPAKYASDLSSELPKLADRIGAMKSSSKRSSSKASLKESSSKESSSKKSSTNADAQRYSLRIESQPLRAVLQQIAKSAKLRLVIDKDAEGLIDERVSISVEKVTLEELVEELVAAAGASVVFSEDKIVVRSR